MRLTAIFDKLGAFEIRSLYQPLALSVKEWQRAIEARWWQLRMVLEAHPFL